MSKRRNVTIHPAALQKAIDAQADEWSRRTDLSDWVARMTPGTNQKLPEHFQERARELLERFAKQCYSEGFFDGGCAAARGLTLDEALQKRAPPENDA